MELFRVREQISSGINSLDKPRTRWKFDNGGVFILLYVKMPSTCCAEPEVMGEESAHVAQSQNRTEDTGRGT
jgi:hypothetical protein